MSLIYQLTDYGRLCGYEKKAGPSSGKLQQTSSAPSTAPLENAESRRYRDVDSPIVASPAYARLNRPVLGRSQSEDRHRFLDAEVEKVAETMSSPRFVVNDDQDQPVKSEEK